MGAKIIAQGKTALFEGVEKLFGAKVYASDLSPDFSRNCCTAVLQKYLI